MATRSKPTSADATDAAPKRARTNPLQDVQEALMQPAKELSARLKDLNVSGGAAALLDSGRKDVQALMQANKASYKGLQTVVQRQTDMLKSSIQAWQGAVKAMPGKDPKQNLAQLDEMGRAAFQQALADMKELAELAARSQADAFEVMRQRIHDNVEQASKLLKPPRK